MSSNPLAVHFDDAGFKLVWDALRTAGLRGVDSEASSYMKRDASIFFATEFLGGARTKIALLEALSHGHPISDISIEHTASLRGHDHASSRQLK